MTQSRSPGARSHRRFHQERSPRPDRAVPGWSQSTSALPSPSARLSSRSARSSAPRSRARTSPAPSSPTRASASASAALEQGLRRCRRGPPLPRPRLEPSEPTSGRASALEEPPWAPRCRGPHPAQARARIQQSVVVRWQEPRPAPPRPPRPPPPPPPSRRRQMPWRSAARSALRSVRAGRAAENPRPRRRPPRAGR